MFSQCQPVRVIKSLPIKVYNWSKAQQVHVLAAPAASTGVASLDNSLT